MTELLYRTQNRGRYYSIHASRQRRSLGISNLCQGRCDTGKTKNNYLFNNDDDDGDGDGHCATLR